jgi:hypothetical protein
LPLTSLPHLDLALIHTDHTIGTKNKLNKNKQLKKIEQKQICNYFLNSCSFSIYYLNFTP